MPCTVIRPGDMADCILNRDKHPEWSGERTKMVYAFPTDEKIWQRYAEIRAESLRQGNGGDEATVFYRDNREAMDAGSRIAWPERFNPDESSFVYEPQEKPLVVGTRYICQYQYEVADEFVYLSQAREDLACGLEFDEYGNVQVDLEAVVEPDKGLEIIEGDSETCDTLAAKIADGLEFDESGAIRVVVGDGLEINAENQVMVNKGCGLEFDEGVLVVNVDPTDANAERLNGPGLTGEEDEDLRQK